MADRQTRTSRISAVVQRRMPSVLRMDSIKSQIVVFALLGALIPSVTMAWVSYVQNKNALTDKITGELKSASAQTAREMDIWLKESLYNVRVFASSYEVSENAVRVLLAADVGAARLEALTRLRDYLNSVRERFPTDYDELLFLDPDGTVVTSTTDGGAVDLPDGWRLDAEADRTVIGTPYWDSELGHAGMAIAIPVRVAGGRLLGALTAKLNLAAVSRILRSFLETENGVVYLITSDGRFILTSSETSPRVMDAVLPEETLAALRSDSLGIRSYANGSGVDVIGAYAAIPRLEWATIAEVSLTEAFSPVTRLRNVTVALVVMLLLGVGLIAYRLALLIARPLDRLTKGAGEVAKGDLAVDLPGAGSGEVGYLTDVFNYMVQRLREGREKLDAAAEELRHKNEALERLSVTDALTGLFNRRHLMVTLESEVRRADRMKHPFILIMADVDNFKTFNDTYGHQAGDEVLARVAAVLKAAIREVDTAARYGGEEFSVLLPETDLGAALDVAERIRQRVSDEPFKFRRSAVTVTLSIGLAEFPVDGDAPESLIAGADSALYQAKRKGRNRVVCATRRRRKTEPTEKEAS